MWKARSTLPVILMNCGIMVAYNSVDMLVCTAQGSIFEYRLDIQYPEGQNIPHTHTLTHIGKSGRYHVSTLDWGDRSKDVVLFQSVSIILLSQTLRTIISGFMPYNDNIKHTLNINLSNRRNSLGSPLVLPLYWLKFLIIFAFLIFESSTIFFRLSLKQLTTILCVGTMLPSYLRLFNSISPWFIIQLISFVMRIKFYEIYFINTMHYKFYKEKRNSPFFDFLYF